MMTSPMGDPRMPNNYGDWIRDKVLGKGAFGVVCLWINQKSEQAIAIKKIIKQIVDHKSMSRWKNEVKLMKEMEHPNIVSFIDIPQLLHVEYPIQFSVGMEYCSGGDLRRFMVKADFCCGLPEYHVKDVLLDIGSAIHYLHEQHNMHRDLKPENIVLKPKPHYPGRYQFKITDLGYAKDLDSTSISGAESFVGTMLYLAPEQLFGHQGNSATTTRYYSVVDYWSFGLVMFECITGRRPFFHNDIMALGKPFMLIREKSDSQICGWLLPNGDKQFCDHIPLPHSLSKDFAADMTKWLRLMLCVEWERRGNGIEWYNMITTVIAPKKYIQVLNMTNMEVLTIQIQEDSLLRQVNVKIVKDLKIQIHHQLLLFANGDSPGSRDPILDQLTKANPESPYDALLYLFDKSCPEHRSYEKGVPQEIVQFNSIRHIELSDKAERHIFGIAINDTFNNVKTGIRFQNATIAMLETLIRSFTRLKEKLQELTHKTYKVEGMRELFTESIRNDIAESENDEQYNSDGIEDDAHREECIQLLEESEDWQESIVKAEKLIREATKELKIPLYVSLHSHRQEISKTKAELSANKNTSILRYDNFRRELKRMNNSQQQTNPRRFRKEQIQSYLDEVWKKLRVTLLDMLNNQKRNVTRLRSYVRHYCIASDLLLQIEGMLDELNCHSSNIKERQENHQKDLWNRVKNLQNVVNQYKKDEDTLPDFHEAQKRFEDVMNDITNDFELTNLLTVPIERSFEHHQTPNTATTSNFVEPPNNSGETARDIAKKVDFVD